MRLFVAALAAVLTSTAGGQSAPRHQQSVAANNVTYGISMRVDAGWNGRYRGGPAWTPVRVSFTNRNSAPVSGSLEIPDTTIADAVQAGQPSAARYGTPVTLPAGATKQITLYLPGSDVSNNVAVAFRAGRRTLSSTSVFPAPYGDRDITVAAVSGDPSAISWLSRVRIGQGHLDLIPLSPGALDAVPEVLASFDVIVLTNVDATRLDRDQLVALERYVRNGGSVLLIGGPTAAETLRALPAPLVPGYLSGSRPLIDLAALQMLGGGRPPLQPATVSVLSRPRGAVLSAEAGVPLVVRTGLGNGSLEYLAFDPALAPFVGWRSAPTVLGRLLRGAAPQAMRRISMPAGYGSVSFIKPASGRLDMSRVVAGLPVPSRGSVLFLALLTVMYILLCGPLCVLTLRRLGRPGLSWLILPLLSLAFLGLFSAVATSARGNQNTVNTVGMVQLDGSGDQHALSMYAGVSAPVGNSYRLAFDASGIPAPIIPFTLPQPGGGISNQTVAWRFQEGVQTSVFFPAGGTWRTRATSVRTSVNVPGRLQDKLHLDPAGDIVGTLQNDTALSLKEPVIVAGRTVLRLPDMSPGATASVRLRPDSDTHRHDYSETLYRVYSQTPIFEAGSDLSHQSSLPDRIREAASALPEAHILSMLGEVTFLAWTEQPLVPVRLNGAIPDRQALTLVAKPLAVEFAPGTSRLRTGTFGASLVEEVPARPRYPCCNPSAQAIYIGAGGSAVFEFDMPNAGNLIFRDLTLSVYGGGPDASYTGYTDIVRGAGQLFDWRRLRWETVNFRNGDASLRDPNRFISSTGALLVKLRALDDTHELTISDPHRDLQLHGTVVVR